MSSRALSSGLSYNILRKLGEGLTSRTYLAQRVDSNHLSCENCVLKVLKSKDLSPLLLQEQQRLLSMHSKYSVKYFAIDAVESSPCLVMEYIDGLSLQTLIPDLLQEKELMLEVAAQLSEALSDLKAQGHFHGDLHPGNILISHKGEVKLIDFALDEKKMGMPRYLSPERWNGQAPKLADDIYALGLLLIDFEEGFQVLGDQECKDRSFSLQNTSPFFGEANHRRILEIAPSKERQKKLASLVSRYKVGSYSDKGTAFLALKKRNNKFWPSLAILMILILHSQTSNIASNRTESPGSILFRTLSWLELSMNQKKIGNSPIDLHLPAGKYCFEYQSQAQKGQHCTQIEAGQSIYLQDKDLLNTSKLL